MLLSFFIILNTISDYEEERSKPVMDSLSAAFSSSPIDEEALGPSTMETEAQSDKTGDALDDLKELFTAEISGLKPQKNSIGTSMSITVKYEDLEEALTQPETAKVNFLPTLISLVHAQNNVTYRMDMVVGTGKNPARLNAEDPRKAAEFMREAAALAQVLENGGLPPKLVSTGLGPGPAGYVELLFQRHEPFDLVSATGAGRAQ